MAVLLFRRHEREPPRRGDRFRHARPPIRRAAALVRDRPARARAHAGDHHRRHAADLFADVSPAPALVALDIGDLLGQLFRDFFISLFNSFELILGQTQLVG